MAKTNEASNAINKYFPLGSEIKIRDVYKRQLLDTLKLLHPFMPFLTEEVFLAFEHGEPTIMRSQWPVARALDYEQEARTMEEIAGLIRMIRNTRAEMNVPTGKKTKLFLKTNRRAEVAACEAYLKKLAYASEIEYLAPDQKPERGMVSVVSGIAEALLPLGELIDVDKEKQPLEKEKDNLTKEIARVTGKLNNQGFVSKAPEKVVAEEREKLTRYQQLFQKVEERLKTLQEMQ